MTKRSKKLTPNEVTMLDGLQRAAVNLRVIYRVVDDIIVAITAAGIDFPPKRGTTDEQGKREEVAGVAPSPEEGDTEGVPQGELVRSRQQEE